MILKWTENLVSKLIPKHTAYFVGDLEEGSPFSVGWKDTLLCTTCMSAGGVKLLAAALSALVATRQTWQQHNHLIKANNWSDGVWRSSVPFSFSLTLFSWLAFTRCTNKRVFTINSFNGRLPLHVTSVSPLNCINTTCILRWVMSFYVRRPPLCAAVPSTWGAFVPPSYAVWPFFLKASGH